VDFKSQKLITSLFGHDPLINNWRCTNYFEILRTHTEWQTNSMQSDFFPTSSVEAIISIANYQVTQKVATSVFLSISQNWLEILTQNFTYLFRVFTYVSVRNKIWLTAMVAKLQFLVWPPSDIHAFKNACNAIMLLCGNNNNNSMAFRSWNFPHLFSTFF